MWIVGIAAVLIAGLALFFEHSIYGKAPRATATLLDDPRAIESYLGLGGSHSIAA
ncbi:MAG: hypothetical protein M0Z99_24265 [Betaproteobacteria bacterium]|nr:hypothetical protein [Betaproteobacteria bacterium]